LIVSPTTNCALSKAAPHNLAKYGQFSIEKSAASQRQDSQYGYSTLRTDNKGVVRDGPGSRSIHQCRRLRMACTTNVFWLVCFWRVFAFKNDAYIYLVDQAEGLTDEQWIEFGQLAELPDREAFWALFNESVSPLTSYRIEPPSFEQAPPGAKPES
jgi:hypothetical protein